MLRIYFKPDCSTCRTALQLVKANTEEKLELIEYLVNTPTQKQLREIVKMLGIKPEDLVRKKEPLFKSEYEGKNLTGTEWIRILSRNPVLIERPILVKDGKAIIGRPVERILEFIK